MMPTVTAIVPARDAAATIVACVAALKGGRVPPRDVIVVDDGSQDDTAGLARKTGATVVSRPQPGGPAAARNQGAAVAAGDLLLFVDADVVVGRETVGDIARAFGNDPLLAAAFGSYDADPAAPNLVSQFKNLAHHVVHQETDEEGRTFWAGCGAVRREVFLAAGGFDARRYPRPSIEDIELGGRLWRAGHRIRVLKTVQVRHLKRWTLASLIVSDIRDRAYPWSRLLLDGRVPQRGLNLSIRHRVAALAAWLAAAGAAAAALGPEPVRWVSALVGAAALAAVLGLNARFYLFLGRARGPGLLAAAIPLHILYYLYSSATFGVCAVVWCLSARRRPVPNGAPTAGIP